MSLSASGSVGRVVGFDISDDTRRAARALGIADEIAGSDVEAASGADLVFIATPAGAILHAFEKIRDVLADGAVVSDVGSVKGNLVELMETAAPPNVHYVGGHPMTGSEQSGVESARPDLFRNASYILTPTGNTDLVSLEKLRALLTGIGARLITMDPWAHDEATATISHVPHLLSLTLMGMAEDHHTRMGDLYTLAAGGFRDMTRIAASSPEMWTDICIENRERIIERLEDYRSRLVGLQEMLESGDSEMLTELFREARRARNELSRKSGLELEELFDVTLPVPDEPGVISKISTAVGELGINIEDVSIAHPLEGETGILTLKILGHEQAGKVAVGLASLGYRASFRKA
jgi:prephenate dehydrogenase